MVGNTNIEWLVLNPYGLVPRIWDLTYGCEWATHGCTNCWAKREAWMRSHQSNVEIRRRYARTVKKEHGEISWTGQINTMYDEPNDVVVTQSRRWPKPSFIFVGSRSDFFHKDVPGSLHESFFEAARMMPQHTFVLLTKRPNVLKKATQGSPNWPLPNVWIGVSVTGCLDARIMIAELLRIPAPIHFVSAEPLLDGLVNFGYKWEKRTPGLDWVICGCESGPGRRPIDRKHIRDLRDWCVDRGTPFFLKQMEVDGKVQKMPELDKIVWDQYPERGQG